MRLFRISSTVVAVALLVCGCGKPNFANIALRNQVKALEQENQALRVARDADRAATRAVDFGANPPLNELVTVSGIKFSRLTVVESTAEGALVLRLYLVPNDSRGDAVKAAGDVAVKVTAADDSAVAETAVPREQLAKSFFGTGVLYTYILDIPLNRPSTMPSTRQLAYPLTARVEFHELLTGRVISATHSISAPK